MRHLKIYRAIRLIAREGSIRKAAEYLTVSPSALNRQVQGFEEEMGVDVFERIPSGVRLSSAGELLVDMIDRHLTEFDDMQSQLNNLRDGLTGTLRVSFGSDVNAGILPACVAAFESDHPGVSVETATDDTISALQQRRVDLAILTNPATDDAVEVVYSQPIALTALHHRDIAPPEGLWDIVTHRLLLPPEGTGTRAVVSHLLRKHRLEAGVTTTLSAAQLSDHLSAAASVSLFPETSIAAGAFRRVQIPHGQVQLQALRATRGHLTRSAQAFLLTLQRQLDAWDTLNGP